MVALRRESLGTIPFCSRHVSTYCSVLLYNSETWPPLDLQCGRKLQHFYMLCIRRVLGLPVLHADTRDYWSDQHVLDVSGLPSIECLLRQRRLVYLFSITHQPAPAITALAQGWHHWPNAEMPSRWAAMLLHDLFELQSQSGALRVLGPPDIYHREWSEFIKGNKWRWKSIIRGYHRSTIAYKSYAA